MLQSQPPETVYCWVGFFVLEVFSSGLSSKAIHDGSINICLNNGTPFIVFLFLFPLSLIKCFGDRCLSCTLRWDQMCPSEEFLHLSLRTVHWTNPLTVLLNRRFHRNTLCTKISSREILFGFRKSLSVLFHPLHYFVPGFTVSPLGSVILLAFGVPNLTPYEQIWCLQKRNVTQKWHNVLSGSRLHSQSATLQQTEGEELRGHFMFQHCSTLQILNQSLWCQGGWPLKSQLCEFSMNIAHQGCVQQGTDTASTYNL